MDEIKDIVLALILGFSRVFETSSLFIVNFIKVGYPFNIMNAVARVYRDVCNSLKQSKYREDLE